MPLGAASDAAEHLSFLSHDMRIAAGGDTDTSGYPSGNWRGYYTYEDSQHGVVEFCLRFGSAGELSGEGADDVGRYSIQGRYCGVSGRVAFTKLYVLGSCNAAGSVKTEENLGHAVEYRGSPARLDSAGRAVLGGGLKGRWHIEGANRGHWHLWPVMQLWPEDSAAEGDSQGDSECCVCFGRTIDTRLEPCGHTCLCASCAGRLRPWRCPLCRSDIQRLHRIGRAN